MTDKDLLPGFNIFLHIIKGRGLKVAVGSSSQNARTILQKVNLSDQFDAVVDGKQVPQAKPNPDIFLLAAQLLKVAPENCVVFEDAMAGVEAARNAGMYCVGVGKPEILSQANQVISSFIGFSLENIPGNAPV